MSNTMGIVSEIKCARCDRKYSGVRSRCPYCGARRIGPGKYSGEDRDNAKGKMLISVLILAVFTVAAGILLFTTPVDAEAQDPGEDASIGSPEDGIESELGLHPEPSPSPTPTPEPEPPQMELELNSIRITYEGNTREDITHPRGVPLELGASWEPPLAVEDIDIQWESSNPEIFDAVPLDVGHRAVRITGITVGTAELILRIGDLETKCIVRIN